MINQEVFKREQWVASMSRIAMQSTRIIMSTYVKLNTVIASIAEVQVYFDLTPIDFICPVKHIS